MIKEMKAKISKEGRTFKWFVKKYLPDRYYGTVMLMLNDYAKLQPDVEKAIEKYLKDED